MSYVCLYLVFALLIQIVILLMHLFCGCQKVRMHTHALFLFPSAHDRFALHLVDLCWRHRRRPSLRARARRGTRRAEVRGASSLIASPCPGTSGPFPSAVLSPAPSPLGERASNQGFTLVSPPPRLCTHLAFGFVPFLSAFLGKPSPHCSSPDHGEGQNTSVWK